jgi:iron complex outermembrane receptor protein
MLFNDELVPNGKVDIYGEPYFGNMKSTVHRGIELSSNFTLSDGLNALANATFSANRILTGSYYIDSTDFINLNGNNISGSPDFMANFGINYKVDNFFVQLLGRYVGDFYSDNFGDNLTQYLKLYPGFVSYFDNKNESYFTADFYASYESKIFSALGPSKIYLQINNIFDKLYSANAIGGEFFPMADRNFLAGVQVGL